MSAALLAASLSSCVAPGAAVGTSTSAPPVATGSGCAVPDVRGAIAAPYRTAAGRCVPPGQLVAVRCRPTATPLVVRRLVGSRPAVFAGGRFAVPDRTLPAGAVTIGVSATEELLDAGGQLYVRSSGGVARWLAVGAADETATRTPRVWMIGDSILDGARDAIPPALPRWEVAIDAEIGRPSSGALAVVGEVAASAPDVVVVEIGTNDEDPAAFRANADAVLASLSDVPLVLWVVPHGPAPHLAAVARELRGAVAAHPNAAVADWDAFVPEDALLDGVHLRPDRIDVFAGFLSVYLHEWRAITTRHGPARCLGRVGAALPAA